MKDAVVNLLVFLLVFLVTVAFLLAAYSVSLLLVPGGRGLVFANPAAAALLPGLIVGLVAAQFRAVRKPGSFLVSWSSLALGFFLLLSLSLPLIEQLPPVRASDASPLVPGRFLPLEDGSLLLESGRSTVLVPADNQPLSVSAETQYDPLNQRFVFSSGEPRSVGGTGPERAYYQYTPALFALQTDLLAVYSALRDGWNNRPFAFWFEAAAVTWLFLGLFVFFSIRTWPLVHVVLVLLLARLALALVGYAFWSVPALVDLWAPAAAGWLRVWAPITLLGAAGATLFFMTLLTKPWLREALS